MHAPCLEKASAVFGENLHGSKDCSRKYFYNLFSYRPLYRQKAALPERSIPACQMVAEPLSSSAQGPGPAKTDYPVLPNSR